MKTELQPAPWAGTLEHKRATAPDGTGIHYEVLGEGTRTILLANGLGGRLYAWKPLLDDLWRDYRLITWDYRGLFDSDSPASRRKLALANHAEDALTVLRAEGVDKAVFVGWSMGVQVSLDVAASQGQNVAGLVLLNGTYGHVLAHGFQPLVTVPWLPRLFHGLIDWFAAHPAAAGALAMGSRVIELPTAALFAFTTGVRSLELRPLLRRYFDDVLGDSFRNYLYLFQELDAHSVYHLLPEIDAPALVVSGMLDVLTPAVQSRRIAKRMPNAERLALLRAGHFSLLERQEVVLPAIRRFLTERAVW